MDTRGDQWRVGLCDEVRAAALSSQSMVLEKIMLEIRLSMQSEADSSVEIAVGTFDESEVGLLRRFSSYVDRVGETRVLKRGMPSITNMSWNAGGKMIWTCPPYEDGELYELLHVLRPLILAREMTSFEHITGLLGKKFNSDRFRRQLKFQRTVYEDGELNLYMQISLNSHPLLADKTLKMWLNGEQYHTDAKKAARWKEIECALTSDNTRALVITQLHAKVRVLFSIQHIVSLILAKADA